MPANRISKALMAAAAISAAALLVLYASTDTARVPVSNTGITPTLDQDGMADFSATLAPTPSISRTTTHLPELNPRRTAQTEPSVSKFPDIVDGDEVMSYDPELQKLAVREKGTGVVLFEFDVPPEIMMENYAE